MGKRRAWWAALFVVVGVVASMTLQLQAGHAAVTPSSGVVEAMLHLEGDPWALYEHFRDVRIAGRLVVGTTAYQVIASSDELVYAPPGCDPGGKCWGPYLTAPAVINGLSPAGAFHATCPNGYGGILPGTRTVVCDASVGSVTGRLHVSLNFAYAVNYHYVNQNSVDSPLPVAGVVTD